MKLKGWYFAAASILFVVCGISLIADGNAGAGITGIVIGALVALPFLKMNGYLKKKRPAKKPTVAAPRNDSISTHEKYLPEIRNYKIKYQYDNVGIASRDHYQVNDLAVSDRLRFAHEPDNAYDPNAVAVYRGNDKIGYLFKGKLQTMCIDFLHAKEPVYGVFMGTDQEREYMTLAFYRYDNSNDDIDDSDE